MDNNNFNLKEKDIYKLFNEIKIEESEFDDMDKEVSTIEKERLKKNLNKKIKNKRKFKVLKYSSAAAVISLACLVGVGTISPSFAQNVPILNSMIQTLNDKMGIHANYAKYSQIINKSIEDNGIKFTLNEIIADDSKLTISYTIKSNKKIKDLEVFGLGRFVKINGNTFSSTGSAVGNYINDHTYVGMEQMDIIDLGEMPKKLNIDLDIDNIGNTKGKWNLAFTASKDEIYKKSTFFKPNTKVKLPDSTINVDKVVFSPLGTYISVNGKFKGNKKPQQGGGCISEYGYWLVYDDKGLPIISNSLGGGSYDTSKSPVTFNTKMEYIGSKHVPKYLTIIPCKIYPSAGTEIDSNGKVTSIKTNKTKKSKEVSKPIDGVYPIELSQGKMGKLIVKEIKTENNKTTVRFTTEGKDPFLQSFDLHIKDSKGQRVDVKAPLASNYEKKPYEFTISFKALDPTKKYSICTEDFGNIEIRDDLKFKIKLNK
ncbi:DUF4179 domain-containing protein [Haloimpatiens sp. FM7330]|uniref:DUF4179 domain-containing protein n=1 Tax=Haloimpatiens sp. FM7330 TaxID=3298610 RepID=UPI00363366F6